MTKRIDKIKETIANGIIICGVIVIILLVLVLLDSVNDRRVCKNEFQDTVDYFNEFQSCQDGSKDVYDIKAGNVYANDDFFVINFGQNVDCSAYWDEDGWHTGVEYRHGTLNIDKIHAERYWL